MGASVGLTASRGLDVAMRAADEIQELGVSAWAGAMELADRVSVDAAVADMVGSPGRLDMAVNNAGVSRRGRLLDLAADDFDYVFAAHSHGFFLVATATRQMAVEWADENIRINAVLPGPVREPGDDWRASVVDGRSTTTWHLGDERFSLSGPVSRHGFKY